MSEEEIYNYLDLKSKEMTLVYGDNIVIAIKMLLDINFIKKSVIRNKIKELEEVKQKEEKENKDEFGINSNTWAIVDWGIEVLKELLGE